MCFNSGIDDLIKSHILFTTHKVPGIPLPTDLGWFVPLLHAGSYQDVAIACKRGTRNSTMKSLIICHGTLQHIQKYTFGQETSAGLQVKVS